MHTKANDKANDNKKQEGGMVLRRKNSEGPIFPSFRGIFQSFWVS
jgi:hypothetical protein